MVMAMLSIMRILTGFAATMMLVNFEVAVDHLVGYTAPYGGWDLSTDLPKWASSQIFSIGDDLVFWYSSYHVVVEVTKVNYDSCGTGGHISVSLFSPTIIPLNATGSRYFICAIGTHCSQGMNIQIDVGESVPPNTTAPPFQASPLTTLSPTPPTNGPTGKSPPPAPVTNVTINTPSSAITLKMNAGCILGFGLLMIMLLSCL